MGEPNKGKGGERPECQAAAEIFPWCPCREAANLPQLAGGLMRNASDARGSDISWLSWALLVLKANKGDGCSNTSHSRGRGDHLCLADLQVCFHR